MASNKKKRHNNKRLQEASLHKNSTKRTDPHSWAWNLPIALALGCCIAPLSLISPQKKMHLDGAELAMIWASFTSITVCSIFLITLSTARGVLSGRSFRENLNWMRSQNPLGALGAITFLTLLLWFVGIVSQMNSDKIVLPVTILMGFLACYRALSLAYRDHYLEFILSPSERAQYELYRKGGSSPSKMRHFLHKSLNPLWSGKRHKMLFPIIQTMIVLYVPSSLGNLLLDSLGYSSFWYEIPSLVFIVISTWIWGRWHLRGGIGSLTVFRFSTGRPMLVNEKR